MANSGTVTAGSAALASQYNNLRDDVLNISTGHTHTGASENGAKVAATGVSSGTAANGAVLTANGSGAAAFLAIGASGGILKYEEFTSSGSFVIPATASSSAAIVLEVIGAGGGGGGGAKNTTLDSTARGGDGGAGGGYGVFTYLSSTFGTAGGTVTVTIGAGGVGGLGTAVTASPGPLGAAGGLTSFGSANFPGGLFGSGGVGAAARQYGQPYAAQSAYVDSYGTAPGSAVYPAFSGAGTAADSAALNFGGHGAIRGIGSGPAGGNGFDSGLLGAGGGGGGAADTSAYPGGRGGKRYGFLNAEIVISSNKTFITQGNGAAGGTASGGAGGAGALAGDGGSGGGGIRDGNGGVGGAGAAPGGGGGGGGGSSGSGTSGAGGAGGAGRVRVWVIG